MRQIYLCICMKSMSNPFVQYPGKISISLLHKLHEHILLPLLILRFTYMIYYSFNPSILPPCKCQIYRKSLLFPGNNFKYIHFFILIHKVNDGFYFVQIRIGRAEAARALA